MIYPQDYPSPDPGIQASGSSAARIASSNVGTIATFAGNGSGGFSGDGGPAADASLNEPSKLAFDESGNLYIADKNNHRLREVDANEEAITTAVGNGTPEASGESTVASEVSIGLPSDVAVDAAGNLFIADVFNSRIIRVAPDGTASTVAGRGSSGFSGDGGPAVEAELNVPAGVAVDRQGNLFIADRNNHRVRRVDLTSGVISTIAGDGTAGFSGDGGPATSASLNYPSGVAVDTQGNLLIADTVNGRIRTVRGDGTITTLAGSQGLGFSGDGGPATEARLNWPSGMAEDRQGNLFIADSNNNRIRRVSAEGIIDTVAGNGEDDFSGDGGPATEASLSYPTGVAVDSSGNLYIADHYNHRIRKVTPVGASPQPAATPTPTPVPATPTPTPVDATPTPTPAIATPTPAPVFATPTPTPAIATPTPAPVFATPTPPATISPGLADGGDSGSGGGGSAPARASAPTSDGSVPIMPPSATPSPVMPEAVSPPSSPWPMAADRPNPTITPVPTPTAVVSPTATIPPPVSAASEGDMSGGSGFSLGAVFIVAGLFLVGGVLGIAGIVIIYLIQAGRMELPQDSMAFRNR